MSEASRYPNDYPNLYPSGPASGSPRYDEHSNGTSLIGNIQSTAASSLDSIKNSQTVQTITNGPMAEKARAEVETTRDEFSNLAAARQTPKTQTATGQALTHYHSFFYNLLSWENPRATSVSYVAIVTLIFTLRYVPVIRYVLRVLYLLLGLTATAELIGKFAVGNGFASKMRPKRYYTIPRETLESILADVEELINFFVIEFQRIVFAENVHATVGAFATAFVTYWLIRIMPTWGIALFFTTVIFFTPLTYIQNRELIDQQIADAQNLVVAQSDQLRDLAAQHTNKAVEMSQVAFQEYSAKAQELIGVGKKTAVEKGVVSPQTAEKVAPTNGSATTTSSLKSEIKSQDFPTAPKQEFVATKDAPNVVKSEPQPIPA